MGTIVAVAGPPITNAREPTHQQWVRLPCIWAINQLVEPLIITHRADTEPADDELFLRTRVAYTRLLFKGQ